MYEVWTKDNNGEMGTHLFTGKKVDCNRYVRQAVKKGANPETLIIRKA